MSTYRNGTGCQAWPLSWIMIALSIEEVGAIVPQQGKNESNQKSAPAAHTLRNPLRPFLEVSYHNLFGLEKYSFNQKSDQNYQRRWPEFKKLPCYAMQINCVNASNYKTRETMLTILIDLQSTQTLMIITTL